MRLFKTIQYTPNVAFAISLVNQNRYSFGAANSEELCYTDAFANALQCAGPARWLALMSDL
jgi:hypothetical protein